MKKKSLKDAKTFDELLEIKYGKTGTAKRDKFEEKAQYFVISEMPKVARKKLINHSIEPLINAS